MSGVSPSGEFVLGVDGGGTGSRIMIMNMEGQELLTVEGPPSLVNPANPGLAAGVIDNTIRAAAEKANVELPARALWAGLAGAGRRGAREAVEIALRSLSLAERVRVGMDVEGAHADAFQDGPGVLVVLGTGSMVWGRDPDGGEIRVGGWGETLGDEGSGYWIGLQGLRAVALARDGRAPATVLSSLVPERLGLPDPEALIPWIAEATKKELAALAPLVLDAAENGDTQARSIRQSALQELRRHLEVVREAWKPWGPPVPLALVGGLVEEGAPLRTWAEALARELEFVVPDRPVSPVRGAARKALALARGP